MFLVFSIRKSSPSHHFLHDIDLGSEGSTEDLVKRLKYDTGSCSRNLRKCRMDIYRWKTRAHNLWDSSYILLPIFPGNPIWILFWGRYRGVGEAQWAAYPTALPGPDTPETQHSHWSSSTLPLGKPARSGFRRWLGAYLDSCSTHKRVSLFLTGLGSAIAVEKPPRRRLE